MSKKRSKAKPTTSDEQDATGEKRGVSVDKEGNICIKIHAKPGSKVNKIVGIGDEGYEVQINAPPVEGEANMELIKYMASVLDIRKTSIALHKGAKSKHKTLLLMDGILSASEVVKRLKSAISSD